jgi:hypothetical protein
MSESDPGSAWRLIRGDGMYVNKAVEGVNKARHKHPPRRTITIDGQTLYAIDAGLLLEDESNHHPARPGHPLG